MADLTQQAAGPRSYGSMWRGLALLSVIGLFTAMPTFYLLVGSFNVAGHGEIFRLGLDNWREISGDSGPSSARPVAMRSRKYSTGFRSGARSVSHGISKPSGFARVCTRTIGS